LKCPQVAGFQPPGDTFAPFCGQFIFGGGFAVPRFAVLFAVLRGHDFGFAQIVVPLTLVLSRGERKEQSAVMGWRRSAGLCSRGLF